MRLQPLGKPSRPVILREQNRLYCARRECDEDENQEHQEPERTDSLPNCSIPMVSLKRTMARAVAENTCSNEC